MIDWAKFLKSVGYAWQGIIALVKSENNAKIHLLATIIVLLLGFYFRIDTNDWRWIVLAITLVWVAEAFNTALETIVDLASPEIHPLAKKAKDLAAAAVLFCSFFAICTGIMVFWPLFF